MAGMGLKTKTKNNTVIHRTTSETLRLGDSENVPHGTGRVSTTSNNLRKKSQTSPSCSFQITGVSLTRCDLGDDSADDLDESHTDDISRVTDNETPSFSEDSKDTDDHIPTAPTGDLKWQEQDNRGDLGLGRFKVVKIESVAPFSRGRWTCFDYLDHSENVPKVSYVYCKQQFVRQGQDKCSNSNIRPASASFTDNSFGPDESLLKRVPNTQANFWEPAHCQEYLYHAGTMILPHPIFVPIPQAKPQKNKPRPSSTATGHPDENNCIKEPARNSGNLQKPDEPVVEPKAPQNDNQNPGASVSCTATIDTKIEHALDVVKNHLTHAVRLEVEELKVKINELVDRISYLEYENDLLRANVAPDILATLSNNAREK